MYFLADAAVYLRSTAVKRLRQARRYEGFSSFLHYSMYFLADAAVYLRSTVAKRLRQARRYEGFSSFFYIIAYIFWLTQPYTFDPPQLNGFVKLAVTKVFPFFTL